MRRVSSRISSFLLAILMMVSMVDGTFVSAFATDNNDSVVEKKENIVESDEYATGDLSTVFDKYFDTNDVSNEEFDAIVNSDNDANNDITELSSGSYPSAVDNSDSKYFPEIGNQMYVGSCTSWAEVYYAFNYARCRAYDLPATGDNILSPAFAYNQVKRSGGGSAESEICSILKELGTPKKSSADFENYYSESDCKSWFPEENIWKEAINNRLTEYTYISSPGTITSPQDSDLDTMKKYLNDGYLITYTTYFNWNKKRTAADSAHPNEYIAVSSSLKSSTHRMTIVGYDDNVFCDINGNGTIEDAERGAFKIVNSWGVRSDQNGGFLWVSYDALNTTSQVSNYTTPGTRTRIFYSMVVQYVKPEVDMVSDVNMVMTLNTAKRNQMKIIVEAENNKTGEKFNYSLASTRIFNYLEYSLDGSEEANDGTIAFDLNNVVSNITPASVNDYTWSVKVSDTNSDGNAVVLKNARIEADGTVKMVADKNLTAIDGNSQTFTFSEANFQIYDVTWNYEGNESSGTSTKKFTINTNEAVGGVEYKFVIKDEANTLTEIKAYSAENTVNWAPKEAGKYTIYGYAKTPDGNEIYKTFDFKINPNPRTSKLTFDTDTYYVNKKITVNAEFEAGTGDKKLVALYVMGGNYPYTTRTNYFKILNSNTAEWTPDMDGEYTIYATTGDNYGGINLQKMGTIYVNKNVATVYYNNDSWDQAYIHYKVGNGTWTSAPGVKMESEDSVSGYKWAYDIELGDESKATVCFNNGNGSWDSGNGSNYQVEAGKNGIKNGRVEAIKMSASVDISGTKGNMYAKVNVKNGTAPYTYEYSYTKDGEYVNSGTTTNDSIYMSVYSKGYFVIDITVTDALGNKTKTQGILDFPGLTVNITSDVASPQKVGSTITFKANVENYFYYKFPNPEYWSVKKDGENFSDYETGVDRTITIKDAEAGVYEVKFVITRDASGEYAEGSMTFVVNDSNAATVYYSHDNWSSANIHYAVNNKLWTSAPGVKMENSDIEGYDFKYVIDLGEENGATVCFNNGNNSWDSNNGQNYKVEAGTYGIKNGKIVTLEDKMTVSLAADRENGEILKDSVFTATAKNGKAVKYEFYVYSEGSTRNTTPSHKCTDGKYTWNPYHYSGNYIVEVDATDDKGNVATAKMNYKVIGVHFDSLTVDKPSPQKVGTTVEITATVNKDITDPTDGYRAIYIKVSDEENAETVLDQTFGYDNITKANWTPTKAGEYTITATLICTGSTDVISMKYKVGEASNTAKIYYNNSNWSSANIHYAVNNKSWTAVPGVKMQASDNSKYTWMYVIDLGEESGATLCFNNGNNSWDSNNGQNYKVGTGSYEVIYGQVHKIS